MHVATLCSLWIGDGRRCYNYRMRLLTLHATDPQCVILGSGIQWISQNLISQCTHDIHTLCTCDQICVCLFFAICIRRQVTCDKFDDTCRYTLCMYMCERTPCTQAWDMKGLQKMFLYIQHYHACRLIIYTLYMIQIMCTPDMQTHVHSHTHTHTHKQALSVVIVM